MRSGPFDFQLFTLNAVDEGSTVDPVPNLSLLASALRKPVACNSFACHTYRKGGGGGSRTAKPASESGRYNEMLRAEARRYVTSPADAIRGWESQKE
jgi:hypothetical protein